MSRTRDLASILGKTEAANTTNVALGTGSGGGLDSASTIQLIDSDYVSNLGGAVGFCSFNIADPTNTVGDTLNHSSISDGGSSLATLTFTTNFAAVDYTACSTNPFVTSGISRNFSTGPYGYQTGQIGLAREDANGSATDEPNAHGPGLAFFGTLV